MKKPSTDDSLSVKDAIEAFRKTLLFKYQWEWLSDRSRFKICNKARQIGISEMLGLEACMDVLGYDMPNPEPVYFVSRTEKQSIYLLEKFYKWMELFQLAGLVDDYEHKSRTECRINGVDISSLTSSAVAGEGFTGNVYLDEFGLHDNDQQIYRSLYPSITWGYKLRIVSRPFGQNNLHYRIFTDTERFPDYHRYQFDIHRAVGDGLPIDIDELRRNFDSDGFAENYLCAFIDESTAFLPYDLLRSCIGECVASEGQHYLGVDIGRKRDATILVVGEQLSNDLVKVVEVKTVKHASYDDQEQIIARTIEQWGIRSGAMDATGLGNDIAERINNRYPFIEPLWFNQQVKESMAVSLRKRFESKTIEIPDDENLITDCHAIRRMVTKNNNTVFDAERNAEGHADRFWALALMNRSIGGGSEPRILFV